jgi:hypothetical protein
MTKQYFQLSTCHVEFAVRINDHGSTSSSQTTKPTAKIAASQHGTAQTIVN